MSEHHEIARLRRKIEALAGDHTRLLIRYNMLIETMAAANLSARVAELETKIGRKSG